MRRLSLILATVVAMMLAGAGVASAQQYPPAGGTLTVSAPTVTPGGTLTITGGGFLAGTPVITAIEGTPVAESTANNEGFFSAVLEFPAETPAGTYSITSSGLAPDGTTVRTLSSEITVVGPTGDGDDGDDGVAAPGATPTTMATGMLPRTGADTVTTMSQVAFAMLVLGAAMVGLVWRRRRTIGEPARTTVDV